MRFGRRCAIVFVQNWNFAPPSKDRKKKTVVKERASLGTTHSELFGCFATLRPFVLALARDGKADACFEDAVAALTNVKPPAEARKWVELEGAHKGWATTKRCAGRFTPKLPPSEAKADDAKLSYAAWLAGCIDGLAAASDVEINLMTCSVHKSNCRDALTHWLICAQVRVCRALAEAQDPRGRLHGAVGLRRVLWRRGVARGPVRRDPDVGDAKAPALRRAAVRRRAGAAAPPPISKSERVAHGVDVGRRRSP